MVAKGGVVKININPTEKRDQHCKIYVEQSLKNYVDKYALKRRISFSEAGRELWIIGLKTIESTMDE